MFPLWQEIKPSPDTDVIYLIESVHTQCQQCFIRSVAPTADFTLFRSIVIRPERSHNSYKVVLCSCNFGVIDFLSPGQTEFTSLQMLILLLRRSPFVSDVLVFLCPVWVRLTSLTVLITLYWIQVSLFCGLVVIKQTGSGKLYNSNSCFSFEPQCNS